MSATATGTRAPSGLLCSPRWLQSLASVPVFIYFNFIVFYLFIYSNVLSVLFTVALAGSYQEGGRLIIPECRPAYSGQYVCTIYLVNGERRVAYASLVVEADGERGQGVLQR